jgi:hypothetical protein
MKRGLSLLATVGLVVFPPLGLLLFLVHFFLNPRFLGWSAWLNLALPLLFILPFQLFARPFPTGLLGQAILVVIAGLILKAKNSVLRLGLFVALLLAVTSGLLTQELSKKLWLDPTSSSSLIELVQGLSVFQSDQHPEQDRYWTASKTWAIPLEEREFLLRFEARLRSGQTGWDWYRYAPGFRLEPYTDEAGQLVTKVFPPDETETGNYITREVHTGRPIAGRTFRARVTLKIDVPVPTSKQECRGTVLILQENGGKYRGECQSIALTKDWQEFELLWEVPLNVTTSGIRLVIKDVPGDYQLTGGTLEELIQGRWTALNVEPVGLTLRLFVPEVRRQELASFAFLPSSKWQAYNYTFSDDRLRLQQTLTLLTQIEGGTNIEMRNIRLSLPDGSEVPALPNTRTSLWFPQANLAGHSIATAGLILVSLLPSLWLRFAASLLTLFTVYLTGSRAAWLAALLGLSWLLWLKARTRERVILVIFILLAGVGFVVTRDAFTVTGLARVFDMDDANTVTRTEIWQTAWQAFLSHPWRGIGGQPTSFADYWQVTHPETREVIYHAHNLYLQFAASYGLPGLLAILWITLGLLWLAWQRLRWQGLALMVGVLFMNMFDYTLFYSSLFYPLILVLNGGEGSSEIKR